MARMKDLAIKLEDGIPLSEAERRYLDSLRRTEPCEADPDCRCARCTERRQAHALELRLPDESIFERHASF